MGMDLKDWVSDKTIRLTGSTHSTIVDFIIAQASSAKSPEHLHSQLSAAGFEAPETKEFAEELYVKVPRKAKSKHELSSELQKKQARERIALNAKNKSYNLLLDTESTLTESPLHSGPSKRDRKEKNRDKKLKTRKKDDVEQWESDEEEERAAKRRRDDHEESQESQDKEMEEEDPEAARLKDLRERDEYAERIRQKDMEASKKRSESHSLRDARNKLLDDEDSRRAALPDLRHKSRQDYLVKREEQQLELLKAQVADDELIWKDEKLTKRERRELVERKETLRLALERKRINDGGGGYQLPDASTDTKSRAAVLKQKYKGEAEADFITDGEAWEQHQTRLATAQIGTMGKPKDEDQYELIFDQIDFVSDGALAGAMSQEEQLRQRLEQQLSAVEQKAKSIDETRKSLPIFPFREDLLAAIERYQVLIICGETGSGKSTQIAQYLHETGYTKRGMIGVTQPRRVAAMALASRVAEELGTRVGGEVGYTVRFEDVTSDRTKIKFMTDGLLMKELQSSVELADYSAIMIDEAHERSVNTDLLMALLKDIMRARPDLRLLISSATLDSQQLSTYFDDAPVFNIPGRRFDVQIYWSPAPEASYINAAITTIFQIHTSTPASSGDILAFMTGQEEIDFSVENITEICRKLGNRVEQLIVLPLYANLPSDLQAKIFEPTPQGARKVVISTNIAETSLTLPSVVYVIDAGLEKQNSWSPKTGIESLVVVPISRASAQQRAGRAGRTQAGKCFRLYTRHAWTDELEDSTTPEIQRTNITQLVLNLKSLGVDDLIHFDFLSAPSPDALRSSLTELFAIGALNDRGELTRLGRKLAELPIDIKAGAAILASDRFQCSEEVLSILSLTSEASTLFYRPKGDKRMHADSAHQRFYKPEGDFMMLLSIWNEWVETEYSASWCREQYLDYKTLCRARNVREQLARLCERVEVEVVSGGGEPFPIIKALTAGYFLNAARLDRGGDSYRTVKTRQTVHIHPSSCCFSLDPKPKWVIYDTLQLTSREFMRCCLVLPKSDFLTEAAPHYYARSSLEPEGRKLPKTKGLSKI